MKSLQALIVVTPNWDAVSGVLYRYARASIAHAWERVGYSVPVNIGENGMAWGIGLHHNADLKGAFKKEGDRKAPAGIFSLVHAFGDTAHRPYAKQIPYLPIERDLECVDDPSSRFYNQFVRRKAAEESDWKSSEKMAEVGYLYALGLVVGHNIDSPQPGLGSCIFMHIWPDAKTGSAGCTIMEESNLIEIISWLDIAKEPCLIQLPSEEYAQRQAAWNLPDVHKCL